MRNVTMNKYTPNTDTHTGINTSLMYHVHYKTTPPQPFWSGQSCEKKLFFQIKGLLWKSCSAREHAFTTQV